MGAMLEDTVLCVSPWDQSFRLRRLIKPMCKCDDPTIGGSYMHARYLVQFPEYPISVVGVPFSLARRKAQTVHWAACDNK